MTLTMIRKIFDYIDLDNDDQVTRIQVIQGLSWLLKKDVNEDHVNDAFEMYADENGFMDLTNFIVSFSIFTNDL